MEIEKVKSSMIKKIGYDDSNDALFIHFKSNDAIWRYENVDDIMWKKFKNSKSKGKFFWKNIKGAYIEKKVKAMIPEE